VAPARVQSPNLFSDGSPLIRDPLCGLLGRGETMRTVFVAIILLLLGCATSPDAPTAGSYPDEAKVAGAIQSLFPSDSQVLSDEQIAAILEANSILPRAVSIAVVHLRHASAARYWGWDSELEPEIRRQLADSLLSALATSDRVTRSAYLPSFLLPETPSVGHLREASARFQSDAVLVFRTECEIYQRFRIFRSPTAKASCRAEAALLDVRTGIVPFSAESLQEFEIAESRSDANYGETIRRAESLALDAVLKETGTKTARWLQGALQRARPNQQPLCQAC